MKTMMKFILLSAAALAAVVIIVCCGALWWIQSSHALAWVQSQINARIPGNIAVEHHRLSPWKPSVDLHGVALYGPRGAPLAGFDHFSVVLDWWPLVRGEIRIEQVLLAEPWADLAVHATHGLNLSAALIPDADRKETESHRPDPSGFQFNITVQDFRLTGGRMSFTAPDDSSRLNASGITLSAAGNIMDRSGRLDLKMGDVRFNSDAIHPEPASIDLQIRLDGGRLVVSAFNVVSGQTEARLSGTADQIYGSPKVEGTLTAETRLEELAKVFGLSASFSGPLKARLTVSGDAINPDAGLVLYVEDSRLAGQPVDRGDLSLRLQDRQVSIDPLSFRLADGSVTLNGLVNLREAFPENLFSSPTDIDNIDYTLDVVQDIPDLNPWVNRFIDLSGRMTGRWSLSGKGVTPAGISASLSMNGSGQDLMAPGMDRPLNADVNLATQMDQGKITIASIETVSDGLELAGDGYFQIDDQALAGNLAVTAVDLAHTLAVVGLPFVEGACNAALSMGGSLRQPQFSADVAAKNLKIDAYTLGNVSIKAAMDSQGRLQLTDLALQNQDSRIQGHGRLRLLPQGLGIDTTYQNALELSLENVSASDFMHAPPIDGTLHGRLKVAGTLDSLGGELSFDAAGLKTDAATLGDVDARIRLDGGTVVVDRLHLKNKASAIATTGRLDLLTPGTLRLLADPTFDFSARSDHIDPGHFVDMASGDFSFSSELTGSLNDPVGKLSLIGRQANLAGQPVETLSLEARFEEQRLWLDQLVAAVAPGEQVDGSGWVGLDRLVDLHLKTSGIGLAHIDRLDEFFPGEGTLHVDMTARGRIDNPDIEGRLTVSDIVVNDEALEDIDLAVTLHDMQARASGNLNFEMDATCDLKKGDFDVNLVFDRTETAAYFKAAGKSGLHGTLTGRVQAVGNIRDAANASAQVDLSALHLMFEKIPLVQSDRIALQLSDQTLSISDFNVAILSEGHLRLKGDARIGGPLDMAVDGRIPLAAAKHFSDAFTDATGMVDLEGNLTGQTSDPQVDARLNLKNIGMTVPGLVQRLRDLNGSVHLTNDRVVIDTLEGFLDTGSFAISGTIDHDRFEPVRIDLSMNARSLPLEIPDTLAVLVNGDIQVRGADRQANARGEIVLLEGVYYKDVNVSLLQVASSAADRQRAVTPKSRPITIPYFDTIGLNIAIRYRQPFDVQNNVAQLEISPDLRIRGTLNNPIVSGRAQVREGFVTFQRRDFEVRKGIIDFINPYRTVPEIDIQSEAEIRTWKINLALKGTPDNLDVTLTSVPSETEADILSLILLGRTTGELTSGAGGSQSTTSQIMAGMITDTFGDDIKRSTGVDILQVESTDGSDNQDAGGVKVTLGKHLSDRMTVKYAIQTTNGETIQRAIMEYKLLERILVNGSQSTNGLFGAELVYRIEFR